MPRARTVNPPLPAETGRRDGLAYTLWLPSRPAPTADLPARAAPHRTPKAGGVVILHGAGSCKESHHDFARAALAAGMAAVAFDQRGHGESAGALDGRAIDDVAAMADLLRDALGGEARPRVALRGSSMGGFLALAAAHAARASAVVAICPASAEGLRRGLAAGRFPFRADPPALDRLLAEHDLHRLVPALEMPVLLLHAEGDEQVPVEHSRELAARLAHPDSRLIAVPGGHHRSVQHDPELQAVSLRFIARHLS